MTEEQRLTRNEYAKEWMRKKRAGLSTSNADPDDLPIAPGKKPKQYQDFLRDERRKKTVHARFKQLLKELKKTGRYGDHI